MRGCSIATTSTASQLHNFLKLQQIEPFHNHNRRPKMMNFSICSVTLLLACMRNAMVDAFFAGSRIVIRGTSAQLRVQRSTVAHSKTWLATNPPPTTPLPVHHNIGRCMATSDFSQPPDHFYSNTCDSSPLTIR